MSPWILSENIFENLPLRGLFTKNVNVCLNVVNDFRLQTAISPKWIQIAESHDSFARLGNVGFPFMPLESIKVIPLACGAHTRIVLSNATSRMMYEDFGRNRCWRRTEFCWDGWHRATGWWSSSVGANFVLFVTNWLRNSGRWKGIRMISGQSESGQWNSPAISR